MGVVPPQDPHGRNPPKLEALGSLLALAPFDVDRFVAGDLRTKMNIAALSWADYGFGAPKAAYAFYLLKHAFWLYAWAFFAGYSPAGAPTWSSLATFDAMQRLVLWNLLFESMGVRVLGSNR